MAAPTAITVETDRDEYSRFEEDRDTVNVTVTPAGANLLNEVIVVELRKARRARTETVSTRVLTLTDSVSKPYETSFHLPSLVDEEDIPKVRRGEYFVYAYSGTTPAVDASSTDFTVSLVTVTRLKGDYLHGTDQMATEVLSVAEQPQKVTGVTVEEVSLGHSQKWHSLSFNRAINATPTVLGVTVEPFALVNGQTLVLRVDSGDAQTATFLTAQFAAIGAATAAEVAAVITAAIPDVTAVAEAGKVRITGGHTSLFVDSTGTATTALGLLNQSSTAIVTRTLSWCGGPSVSIETGKRTYLLRNGTSTDYIRVRVASVAQLPTQTMAEELLIHRKPLDETRMRQIVEQSISWIEDTALTIYLEPTVITTEIDPTSITYGDVDDTPIFEGAVWDAVVDGVTHTAPTAGHWTGFKFPYQPILRFDELWGKVGGQRVITLKTEWVQAHQKTGWVELVPYHQTSVNFIGLTWMQSLRSPTPLPGFWQFTAVVGYRQTPEVLLELVAKKAAMDILTIAGMARRAGVSSQSLSRDGVSESVSYTAGAQYSIYSATIEDYRKWIEGNLIMLKGSTRGPSLVVC